MHTDRVLALARAAAEAEHAAALVDAGLPVVLEAAQAASVAVCRREDDALVVVQQVGAQLEEPLAAGTEQHELPGHLGVLVVAWSGERTPGPQHELALAVLLTGVGRLHEAAERAELIARSDNAQHLAGMGDYDWHIPSDTVRWSDGLFRIYGHEPQSFVPSYATFLSLIHPEDREQIQSVHRAAYATGDPYRMIERIVRPDGEVRHLSSNGEVLRGPDGSPERMRGTCIDITERIEAEGDRERGAARLRGLVAAFPRAVLLVDDDGIVLEANPSAHELLAGDPLGAAIDQLIPERAGGLGLAARRLDGVEIRVDIVTTVLPPGPREAGGSQAIFLEDAHVRENREVLTARLGQARLRRRQALEINDNVVQGLVAASYVLDAQKHPLAATYLQQTLAAAREMMNDLLVPLAGEDIAPGDLVRTEAATIGRPLAQSVAPVEPATAGDRHRVLLVDDAEDVRLLTRTYLDRSPGLKVVGEAGDGISAIEQARVLQPDLVLLDMAMPRMDGLEALPHIKEAAPGVQVIVFSGFDEAALADKARLAGADGYAVKGGSMKDLVAQVNAQLQAS